MSKLLEHLQSGLGEISLHDGKPRFYEMVREWHGDFGIVGVYKLTIDQEEEYQIYGKIGEGVYGLDAFYITELDQAVERGESLFKTYQQNYART